MAKNRSHEALKHVWVEWRKASGNKYKNDYLDFIDLNNEGAKELGKSSLINGNDLGFKFNNCNCSEN